MGIHQADLYGSKKEQERIDRDALKSYLDGDVDLKDGLGLDEEVIQSLRRQATALLAAGKWQRAIDVVLALVALGSVHPADPLLLARAYRELGMHTAAAACLDHGVQILDAMGLELPPELEEEEARHE